jgi:hypothetical protein
MFESLPCLRCTEENSTRLNFAGECFECVRCDAEIPFAEIDDALAKWGVVLSWVRTAPIAWPDVTSAAK